MEAAPKPLTPKNALGFWSTAAIGIGGMVGGGVFAVFGIAATIAKGGVPIAFLVAGLIALLTSYSYTKFSLRFPSIGGTVTFLNEAFGPGVLSGGFGLLLCLSYIIMLAVYAHAFANYALKFFPEVDPEVWGYVIRSGVVVLLTLLNALTPRLVVKSEIWVDLLKVLLLIFFVGAGLGSVELHRLSPATWPPAFEMLAGGMTLFLCYEGFELIANASKDVANPEKNLPRAFYSSIGFVILLYLLIATVVIGNLSLSEIEKNSGSALAESARPFLGDFGFTLIAATALLAAGSAINATLYGSARITSILARRRQLFEEFRPAPHHRPVAGLFLMSALTLLAANFLDLASVSTLGSAGFLLIFAAVNGANFRLRRETKSRKYLPLLGAVACLSALFMMLVFTWKKSPHQVWQLIGMLAAVFLFEGYQNFSGRRPSSRFWVLQSYLDSQRCRQFIQAIQRFRKENPLPEIYRPAGERALRYFVINGRQVAQSFPELQALASQIKILAEEKSGLKLELMKNEMVGININITPPGGEYRWHYDRNILTAILFLNEVAGGETEVYPGYRIKLKNKKHPRSQEKLDRVFMTPWLRRWLGRKTSIAPQAGTLLLMRGDECLHSVSRVAGSDDRINVLFSYECPGTQNPQEDGLNTYLYTDQPLSNSDPNYLP